MRKKILLISLLAIGTDLSAQNVHFEKGYAKSIGLNACYIENYFAGLGLQTYQGYNLGNGLSLGGLTGLEYHDHGESVHVEVPITLQCSYRFIDERISPFVSGGIGTNFKFDCWPLMPQYTTVISAGVDFGKWAVHYSIRKDYYTYDAPLIYQDISSMLGCSYCF